MRSDLYEDMYKTEEKHWWHRAKRRIVGRFITSYCHEKNPNILDVGCGTGKNMDALQKQGDVWGIDISQEALLYCKKRGLTQIKKGSAENIPFDSEIFDVVCALDVLEHVDDISAVKEIKRIIKNNGYIIITVPAFDWLWSKWDEVLHHKRRYTKETLSELLRAEGFTIKKNTYMHSFLVVPIFLMRKIKERQKKHYDSDFQINNNGMNIFFSGLSKLEQWWINRYDMPFGTSVLCIAQKEPQKSPL